MMAHIFQCRQCNNVVIQDLKDESSEVWKALYEDAYTWRGSPFSLKECQNCPSKDDVGYWIVPVGALAVNDGTRAEDIIETPNIIRVNW